MSLVKEGGTAKNSSDQGSITGSNANKKINQQDPKNEGTRIPKLVWNQNTQKPKTPQIQIPPVNRKPWRPEAWKSIPTSPNTSPLNDLQLFLRPQTSDKYWNNFKIIGPKTMILRGTYSLTSKRYGLMCCGKQSAPIAIVVLGFRQIIDDRDWISSDMDRILDEGTKLYKRTILQSNLKRGTILNPNEVFSSFYINSVKIIAVAGKDIFINQFEHQQLEDDIKHFLNMYEALIFNVYDRSFPIWKNDNYYYTFNSQDVDMNGNSVPMNYGGCACLRMGSLRLIISYVKSVIKRTKGKYQIHSVNILKITKPGDSIKPVVRKSSETEILSRADEKQMSRPITVPMLKYIKKPIIEFSKDYFKLNDDMGILRGSRYAEQTMKIPAINLAAIVMLRNYKSPMWDTEKMDEVLDLGSKLYDQNLENTSLIKIDEHHFEIDSEQVVIGEIQSTKPNVCDLICGLNQFFKLYDSGLLQGPQNVGIWQEGGYFFMYDSKERNALGEKFIKNPNKPETHGRACLMWFQNLNDLVDIYIKNIPLKHRFDPYRLTKIEITEFYGKSEDWFEWISIDYDKWIIRGRFSQNNQRFVEENRNKQSTCSSAIALIFSELIDLQNWDREVLEKIMDIGDTLYTKSIQSLKDNERFVEPLLLPSEIVKFFSFEKYKIEFMVDEGLVYGILGTNQESEKIVGSVNSLEEGVSEFFKKFSKGILISCQTSLAIWKSEKYFYYFDSHTRDCYGNNPMMNNKNKGCLGTCCALRFLKLNQFCHQIIKTLTIKDLKFEFNISRVDFILIEDKKRPTLNYYTPFGETGGILQPVEKGCFEGNRDLFDLRANRQTYCNLIVALAMSQICHSIKWNGYYINDILKIGDKLFCKIVNRLFNEIDDNFVLPLSGLDPELQIGINKFEFEVMLSRKGIVEDEPSFHSAISDNEIKPDSGNESEFHTPRVSQDGSIKSLSNKEGSFKEGSINEGSIKEGSIKEGSIKEGSIKEGSISKEPDQSETVKDETVINEPPKEESFIENISKGSKTSKGSLTSSDARRRLDRLSSIISTKISEIHPPSVPPKPRMSGLTNISTIYDLHTIFNEWDTIDCLYTILETDALTCAIWKQDNLYFVFDPKASDNESKFSNKRLNEIRAKYFENYTKQVEEPEDECRAYVAWFMTQEDLVEHLLFRIPEDFKQRIFSLYKVEFKNLKIEDLSEASQQSKFYEFSFIGNNMSIIRGSISQNNKSFLKYPNRNNQDTTNCITAIAFSLFCDAADWNTTVLDIILKYGDRLYTKSLHFMKKLDESMKFLDDPKLKLHHLATPFSITNMKFYVTVAPVLSENEQSLAEVLEEFFINSENCILMCRNYFVAIWKDKKCKLKTESSIEIEENIFYMFDSHDIGPNGIKRINGTVCLYRFVGIEKMIETFLINCDGDPVIDEIKINSINITITILPGKVKMCTSDENLDHNDFDPQTEQISYDKRDHLPVQYSSFQPYDEHSKIIKGTKTFSKTFSKVEQSCYVLAAILTTKTLLPDYWTEKTLDEIVTLGDRINHEKAINLSQHDKIVQNFSKITIEIELIVQGKLENINLMIVFDHFFEENSIGIYLTENIIVGFWKNATSYYIFLTPDYDEEASILKFYSIKCLCKILWKLSIGGETFRVKKCNLQLKL